MNLINKAAWTIALSAAIAGTAEAQLTCGQLSDLAVEQEGYASMANIQVNTYQMEVEYYSLALEHPAYPMTAEEEEELRLQRDSSQWYQNEWTGWRDGFLSAADGFWSTWRSQGCHNP
ncbi:hypothetical protein [Gemmatimonas sp. UBA7669]|uniref:hypothetical protein n=1 Tax=Gemmatimonas sp. UBA7669 TaxID=1946568 RepID=UPI0025C34507|nr:hypothetical protein [Gemmatimonas sp. UBA7669]